MCRHLQEPVMNARISPAPAPTRSRRLLDAVHRQPPVQGRPAPAGSRRGHALLDRRRPRKCSTASPACGASMPATAGEKSPRRWPAAADAWSTRRPFQMGHPIAFELASRLAAIAPARHGPRVLHQFRLRVGRHGAEDRALAYHRARGAGQRTRLIGREKGYHGVGFGGMSVGGMVNNRKFFGLMLPGVDHLPHTHRPRPQRLFPRPARTWGMHLADELERLVALHDASTIAAVIVEPIAGSAGRAAAAGRLSEAPAGDLRQIRHPVDIRRGDHRLRPRRHALCRPSLRRHPRPDDHAPRD